MLANPPFGKKSSMTITNEGGNEDKASRDIFWLKDDSLDNLDDLPPPDVLQQEIIEHLEAALASFRDVAVGLRSS